MIDKIISLSIHWLIFISLSLRKWTLILEDLSIIIFSAKLLDNSNQYYKISGDQKYASSS